MRILFVSPHFPPDVSALARRVRDLGSRWVAAGHQVQVLCGMPGHPSGVVPPRYRGRIHVHEQVDGIDVHRIWTWVTPNAGRLRRGLGFTTYAASALTLGQIPIDPPDVVVASSPQFLAAVAGVLIGRLRDVPVVVEIRDLWPRSVWEVGAMSREHPVVALLERAERWVYQAADKIVVVAAPFREHILAHAPGRVAEDVVVITNGVDLRRFSPDADGTALRSEWGVPASAPLVLYAGTHGMAHGLETVVDAARRAPEATFVFVGDGARKADVRRHAAGVPNALFFDPVSGTRMPEVYAAADVCVVPLRDLDVFRTVIPSKIFEIWATAKPLVLGVRGESAGLVERAGGGVVVEPEHPDQLAEAIRTLLADPARAASMGKAGRAAVEADYDRDQLAVRYLELLRDTARLRAG